MAPSVPNSPNGGTWPVSSAAIAGPPDVGEDQPLHAVADRLLCHPKGCGVPARPGGRTGSGVPSLPRRRTRGRQRLPMGRIRGTRGPGDPAASGLDQVSERGMRGVHHWVWGDLKAAAGVAADVGDQAVCGRQVPQFADQFRPLVGDQPGSQRVGRGGARATVDGDPCRGVLGEQPGGRLPRRVHRTGPRAA
jgi:hypothetical protein